MKLIDYLYDTCLDWVDKYLHIIDPTGKYKENDKSTDRKTDT